MRPNLGTRCRGFTFGELLVILVVIGVLALMLLPALAAARAKARRITCVSQLKSFGYVARIFSDDNQGRLPPQIHTNTSLLPAPAERVAFFFRTMSNELATPKLLICPSDQRMPAAGWAVLSSTNVSYFIGTESTETQPQALLAGDRNLQTNGLALGPGLVRLSTNVSLGWTAEMHNRSGNVVMGDGSVQQTTSRRLQEMLAAQRAATNDLLVP